MKVTDQENIIRELESALEHVKLQCDRQLTLQHKEHEKKLQLILHHFKGICFLGGIVQQVLSSATTEKYYIPTEKKKIIRFRIRFSDTFWL